MDQVPQGRRTEGLATPSRGPRTPRHAASGAARRVHEFSDRLLAMAILEPGYMEGTRGSMAVDWESRVDMARMRGARLARATDAIARAGYDAVLLLSDPNIRYVTAVATTSVS